MVGIALGKSRHESDGYVPTRTKTMTFGVGFRRKKGSLDVKSKNGPFFGVNFPQIGNH